MSYVIGYIGSNVSEKPVVSIFQLEYGDSRFL
jgi:hypothetical protein